MTEQQNPAPSGTVDAVLLLGRSGHQGAAGEGMEALAEAVRATGRYPVVHTAIAERGWPRCRRGSKPALGREYARFW